MNLKKSLIFASVFLFSVLLIIPAVSAYNSAKDINKDGRVSLGEWFKGIFTPTGYSTYIDCLNSATAKMELCNGQIGGCSPDEQTEILGELAQCGATADPTIEPFLFPDDANGVITQGPEGNYIVDVFYSDNPLIILGLGEGDKINFREGVESPIISSLEVSNLVSPRSGTLIVSQWRASDLGVSNFEIKTHGATFLGTSYSNLNINHEQVNLAKFELRNQDRLKIDGLSNIGSFGAQRIEANFMTPGEFNFVSYDGLKDFAEVRIPANEEIIFSTGFSTNSPDTDYYNFNVANYGKDSLMFETEHPADPNYETESIILPLFSLNVEATENVGNPTFTTATDLLTEELEGKSGINTIYSYNGLAVSSFTIRGSQGAVYNAFSNQFEFSVSGYPALINGKLVAPGGSFIASALPNNIQSAFTGAGFENFKGSMQQGSDLVFESQSPDEVTLKSPSTSAYYVEADDENGKIISSAVSGSVSVGAPAILHQIKKIDPSENNFPSEENFYTSDRNTGFNLNGACGNEYPAREVVRRRSCSADTGIVSGVNDLSVTGFSQFNGVLSKIGVNSVLGQSTTLGGSLLTSSNKKFSVSTDPLAKTKGLIGVFGIYYPNEYNVRGSPLSNFVGLYEISNINGLTGTELKVVRVEPLELPTYTASLDSAFGKPGAEAKAVTKMRLTSNDQPVEKSAEFTAQVYDPTLTDPKNVMYATFEGNTLKEAYVSGDYLIQANEALPNAEVFAYETTMILGELANKINLINVNVDIATVILKDEDGDTVPDVFDKCPSESGNQADGCSFSASLRVSVEEVVAGSKRQDTALETKIFNLENGAVNGILAQPQNYAQIYNSGAEENTQTETFSPNDGTNKPRNLVSDLVPIGATTGNKMVLVKSQQSADGTFGYMGFQVQGLLEGQSRDVGFNIVSGQPNNFVQTAYFTQNSKGIWQNERRAQVIKGSELSVFQPDEIIWTSGTEIYPFLFISDSDWNVDVCLSVPTGYQIVSPGACGQTLVANEAKVFEFTVKDIGSPKNFNAHAKFTFTHKGKKQKFESDIKSHNPKAKGA